MSRARIRKKLAKRRARALEAADRWADAVWGLHLERNRLAAEFRQECARLWTQWEGKTMAMQGVVPMLAPPGPQILIPEGT